MIPQKFKESPLIVKIGKLFRLLILIAQIKCLATLGALQKMAALCKAINNWNKFLIVDYKGGHFLFWGGQKLPKMKLVFDFIRGKMEQENGW